MVGDLCSRQKTILRKIEGISIILRWPFLATSAISDKSSIQTLTTSSDLESDIVLYKKSRQEQATKVRSHYVKKE